MFQLIFGYRLAQVVRAAALYSLAEHLAEGRATPAEIAAAEQLDPDATFRLMRACAAIGLLGHDGQKFLSTPLLATLHKDAPGSMRPVALLLAGPGHWLPWGNLSDAIKTGRPQSVATVGVEAWDYLARSPVEGAAFAATMTNLAEAFNREAVELIDTRAARTAVDVGGATGSLIHALMVANPALRGVVFDLPFVVGRALDASQQLGLHDRFTVATGDFRVDALPRGDLFLLKYILHDWSDADCAAILRNCRRAMDAGGRIVIIDALLKEIGAADPTPLMDMDMLVMLGGRERTLGELDALFAAAGFRRSRVSPTATPTMVIEAIAV